MSPGRRLIAIVMGTQGIVGIAWWVALTLNPGYRTHFQPHGQDERFILLFGLPDAVLFVGGSILTAVLASRGHRSFWPVLWLTAGATGYAALLCVGLALRGPGFMSPTVAMLVSAAGTLTLAITSRPDEPPFPTLPLGPARPDSRLSPAVRTGIQIAVFWGLFLAAIPLGLAWLERGLGVPPMPRSAPLAPALALIGLVLLASGSLVGLWSAVSMVVHGGGTPLPTDAPPRLVLVGPYRFVRNPMALGGLVQGLGVALLLGSFTMVGAVVLGGIIWNACIRPIEEADLDARFGPDFALYRARVRCWFPGFVSSAAGPGERPRVP